MKYLFPLDFGSGQLFPVSVHVSDPPVWSFVVIYFGPATLNPSLSVGDVPPDHSPDGYLQQSVCPVSCETFTACWLCSGSGPVAGSLIQLPQGVKDVQLCG